MTEKKERVRNWALITYHSEDIIKAVLQVNAERIRHWAYIKHDKDTNEDKTLKEAHYHVGGACAVPCGTKYTCTTTIR